MDVPLLDYNTANASELAEGFKGQAHVENTRHSWGMELLTLQTTAD